MLSLTRPAHPWRLALSTLALSALSACGASVPSASLYQGLAEAPAEAKRGELNLSELSPAYRFKEPLTELSMGRELSFTTGEGALTLNEPSPCASLLPSLFNQDQRVRFSDPFDSDLLTTITEGQDTLDFEQLKVKVPVEGASAGSIASGRVGLHRVMSYKDMKALRHYDRCCALTGACGEHQITTLYEVTADVRYFSKQDPKLHAPLLAFEERGASLDATGRAQLAKAVYEATSPAKESAGEGSDTPKLISHFKHRDLPKPMSSPLTEASLSVVANQEVRCKKRKSKQANAIEFTFKVNKARGAEELLGYEAKTSALWVDLSLAKHHPLVYVGAGKVSCRPGPEAFNSYEHVCPEELTLIAFPPTCDSLKPKEGKAPKSVELEWSAQVGVYAPGIKEVVYHAQDTNVVKTSVSAR